MHSLDELLRNSFWILIPFLVAFTLAFTFGPDRLWQALLTSVMVILVVFVIAARFGREEFGP